MMHVIIAMLIAQEFGKQKADTQRSERCKLPLVQNQLNGRTPLFRNVPLMWSLSFND